MPDLKELHKWVIDIFVWGMILDISLRGSSGPGGTGRFARRR
jgi:hypothetical protein